MKKIIISSKRLTREIKANPYQQRNLKMKSNCIDYKNNFEIIDFGNGYSKIIAKDSNKKL